MSFIIDYTMFFLTINKNLFMHVTYLGMMLFLENTSSDINASLEKCINHSRAFRILLAEDADMFTTREFVI